MGCCLGTLRRSVPCAISFYPEHFEEHGLSGVRIAEILSELDRIEQNPKNQVPEIVKCGKVSKVRKVPRGELMFAFTSYLKGLIGQMDHILDKFAGKVYVDLFV